MKQKGIQFEVDCTTPGIYTCHVIIPHLLIQQFFKHACLIKQSDSDSLGFKKGSVPLDYIQVHYKKNILNHMQEIILKHIVLDALLEYIEKEKVLIIGALKLVSISMDLEKDAIYTFEGVLPKEVYIQRWKNLPFKATERKGYRDIDNQVKSFLEEEEALQEKYGKQDTIQIGEWVCFDSWIVDKNSKNILDDKKSTLWLKIGDEEPDLNLQELFVDQKINTTLITDNTSIQKYFCNTHDAPYHYAIAIKDRVPYHYFSPEYLKHHFKLKTKKDLHNKLIEVFSYSCDVSQSRSIADMALNTIVKRNNILVAPNSIIEQKNIIIQGLQQKPDYVLYKMKPNFDNHITTLAKKQLYEIVVVDHIAHAENISVNHEDIKAYFALMQRTRTKEFLYFSPPNTQFEGQELPISIESIKKACLREKTLNHIVSHLTR